MGKGLTYRDAGVDIDAGTELVKRIAPACKATHRPEMLSGLGGFAALAELPSRYQQPVLVTGTDGVGTKLKLAIDNDRHDSVGQDLVAMCANDVLVTGAEPFLFLDYYATGKLEIEVAEEASVLNMKPGDVLVLLSDGVYEFVNREGAQFGEDRVANLMKYHHDLPMADLCRQIFVELEDFGGGADQADDISIVVVKRDPLDSELE